MNTDERYDCFSVATKRLPIDRDSPTKLRAVIPNQMSGSRHTLYTFTQYQPGLEATVFGIYTLILTSDLNWSALIRFPPQPRRYIA